MPVDVAAEVIANRPLSGDYNVLSLAAPAIAQQRGPDVMEATTASGEKVRLLPDGHWEYADPNKAEPQREQRKAQQRTEATSQGGLLGIGRKIQQGDRDLQEAGQRVEEQIQHVRHRMSENFANAQRCGLEAGERTGS